MEITTENIDHFDSQNDDQKIEKEDNESPQKSF